MTQADCHEPTNGAKPKCVRDSDFDRITDRLDAFDERTGEMMREVSAARAEAQAAHEISRKVLDEVLGMRGEMRESEDRRNRECDIRHKPVDRRLDRLEDEPRTTFASLDYDPDEPTLTGREPGVAATVWAARAREGLERETSLRADLAAARATIAATRAERDRHSDRAARLEDRRWTNAQKIGGIIVAIIAALGGGVGLAQLLK